jgi:DNA-binding MarR family transcriptional regulator
MKAETERQGRAIIRPRVSARGRTTRAYGAFSELISVAQWMGEEMAAQMGRFGMTPNEFQVLDLLRRCGPQYSDAVSKRLGWNRSYAWKEIEKLEAEKWVQRRAWRLPRRDQRRHSFDVGARKGRGGTGKPVVLIEFTPEGRKRFLNFLPRRVKLVKAYMRVLDQREQVTLGRLLRKLRRGDVLKFALEVRYWRKSEGLWDV